MALHYCMHINQVGTGVIFGPPSLSALFNVWACVRLKLLLHMIRIKNTVVSEQQERRAYHGDHSAACRLSDVSPFCSILCR